MVMLMARQLQAQYHDILVETDLQTTPGQPVPPIIDGYRPDIYAYNGVNNFYLIGEAKTRTGLNLEHTYIQISSFACYLEAKHQGTFVLGICGEKADSAKTLLRFLRKKLSLTKTILRVFDGCDYWELDKTDGVQWHLS